jgi:hypothetical protein
MDRKQVVNRRAQSIFNFCESLHKDIDELYEVMVDGSDEEEKAHIESVIKKLNELNLDR